MSPAEALGLFLVLGTAKILFLALFFLGPHLPGVPALTPPQPVASFTIQIANPSRVQVIQAAPASRVIRAAQEHHEASGAAGLSMPILPVVRALPIFLRCPSHVPA